MSTSWSALIHQAEKLIGGPVPFINLSSILTSEAGFLASRARRVASNVDHPLFRTIRSSLYGRSVKPIFSLSNAIPDYGKISKRPSGGLIMLLFGQSYASCGFSSTKVCNQHRNLAEIFETVHMAIAIHKSLVDMPNLHLDQSSEWIKHMEMGNKLAILAGDVLLASVSSSLAKFHHAQIVDVISESIGNMIEAEFYPLAIEANLQSTSSLSSPSLPSNFDSVNRPNHSSTNLSPTDKWLSYVTLSRGSLLGSCCQASLLLVEADLLATKRSPQSLLSANGKLLASAKQFGINWACLLRLLEEMEHLQRIWSDDKNINVRQWFRNKSTLDNNTLVSEAVIPSSVTSYKESGILEPTLAYACLFESDFNQHISHNNLLNIYKETGIKLSNQLRDSLDELVSARLPVEFDVTCSPTMNLLDNITDKLIEDLKM